MRKTLSLLTLFGLLAALPLAAQTPMTAAEFERFTSGKTLFFGLRGEPYGVEKYMENRRVRWSFLDGQCKDGEWFAAQNNQICFVYEDSPEQHCWQFFLDGDQFSARVGDDPNVVPLYEAQDTSEKMLCLGPDIGV